MSINALSPAFVRIRYETAYAIHTQTIPTLAYSNSGFGDAGSFATHDTVGIAGDTMVEALITLLALNVNVATTYLDYVIYTQADADSKPIPRFAKVLSQAGALILTGVDKATQFTFSFRTSNSGIFRWVQLDRHTDNFFGYSVTADATSNAVIAELIDAAKGWCGRDGGAIAYFVGLNITMNSRLERKYR